MQLKDFPVNDLDFSKGDGLIPAIVQDARSHEVLMLAFVNEQSLEKSIDSGFATFFSRSRGKLWTKGETSGNKLKIQSLAYDCDKDSVLIKATPAGPTCHTGKRTCFYSKSYSIGEEHFCGFLSELEEVIESRKREATSESSYTKKLLDSDIKMVAQKVGEEATEVVIEALRGDLERLKEESADLLYHLLILLHKEGLTLSDIEKVLAQRHSQG